MLHKIETMIQPNGSYVQIGLENINHLADLRTFNDNARETYYAEIYVYWPYGSYHSPYTIKKYLYGDERGLYTYKKQKEPIYFWKPQKIEDDYEHWTKDKKGYHNFFGDEDAIPLGWHGNRHLSHCKNTSFFS